MVLEILEMLEKLSIGQKCPMDIFKVRENVQKMHISWFNRHRTIYGATFSKPVFHCFSNFTKTPKNKTPVVKCKMDIFKNQECPF